MLFGFRSCVAMNNFVGVNGNRIVHRGSFRPYTRCGMSRSAAVPARRHVERRPLHVDDDVATPSLSIALTTISSRHRRSRADDASASTRSGSADHPLAVDSYDSREQFCRSVLLNVSPISATGRPTKQTRDHESCPSSRSASVSARVSCPAAPGALSLRGRPPSAPYSPFRSSASDRRQPSIV